MDTNLQRAIELIRDQQPDKAREILLAILHKNYDNAPAWFWLAHCAEDDEEYARALREVLRLDPENDEARRLAMQLTRQSASLAKNHQTSQPTLVETDQTRHILSSILNIFGFLIIIAISVGVAYAWLYLREDETPTPSPSQVAATTDAITLCSTQITNATRNIAARCSSTRPGEICLISGDLNTLQRDTLSHTLFVGGNKAPLDTYTLLDTATFGGEPPREWGSLWIKIPTNDTNTISVLVTGGVRISEITPMWSSFSFFSNPSGADTCPELPPSGILASSLTSSPLLLNNAQLDFVGTIFLQLDVAAGLRIAVLEGTITLTTASYSQSANAGQVLQIPVDPERRIQDAPSNLFNVTERIRNLRNLIPLMEGLELSTANWTYAYDASALAQNITPTVTPPLPDLGELSPTNDAPTTTLPPTVTLIIPSFTPRPNNSTTPQATLTPLPPITNVFSDISLDAATAAAYLQNQWRCTISAETNSGAYVLDIQKIRQSTLVGSGIRATTPLHWRAIKGIYETQAPEDVLWEVVPNYRADSIIGWLILQEIVYGTSKAYTLRLILNQNGRISGAIFVREINSPDEILVGFIPNCTQQ